MKKERDPSYDVHFMPKLLLTECPKSNRKSVLHLLKYIFSVYLSRCSTDLRLILGHSV